MNVTDTIVIGGGQAGLAMSRCLTAAGVDHAVLERGRTAERWRSERWDSLRLLTPNWASRLPDWSYRGKDPDGFMSAGELAAYLTRYAASFDAPVHEGQDVEAVNRAGDGFEVRTTGTTWRASNVVIATGWCDLPRLPAFAGHLHPSVTQVTPAAYRRPGQLPDGPVLVVGASATGVQLADELARAGRDVVLAAGRHNRLLRTYRGMDIWWWLEQIGTFSRTVDDIADTVAARRDGAVQLVGRDDRRDVDLPSLQRLGVRLAGRLAGIEGRDLNFADDLAANTAAADRRLAHTLARIDGHIARSGLAREVLAAEPPAAMLPVEPLRQLRLGRDRVAAVVWATGYRREYPWLELPVLDRDGEIAHRRGVTPVDGLYVLGQRFQFRRDSNFIDGVRHDAAFLADRITGSRACPVTLAS